MPYILSWVFWIIFIINLFYIETKDDYFRILSNVLERKIWQMGK